MERGGRLALGADERPGIGAELSGRAPQDGRVLAGVDELARNGDRHRDQLVQGDVEGDAVCLRRGEPLPQAIARRGQVEHEDAAGQVVDDDPVAVPQVAAFLGRPRATRAEAERERAEHERREDRAVVERLGVPVIVAASSASCAGAAFSSIRCSIHSRTRVAWRSCAVSPELTSLVSVPSAASSASQAWNQLRAVRKESSAERMAASRPSVSRCRSAGRSLSAGPRRSSSWARPWPAASRTAWSRSARRTASMLTPSGRYWPVIPMMARRSLSSGDLTVTVRVRSPPVRSSERRAASRRRLYSGPAYLAAPVSLAASSFGISGGAPVSRRAVSLSVHSTEAGTQCRRSRTQRAGGFAERRMGW